MSAIEVKDLGKAFIQYRSEINRLLSWFGIKTARRQELWVLRHVNFSIQKGESIALVGRNGAGKSTLLKLISGVQRATEGAIAVKGKISAILELGMGFNPEFTGRKNAEFGLGLMGFSQAAIARLMPGLEEFAEIGDYFDKPVRTYSSGMRLRLAFAVATAERPQILIIDEAMAVGDAYFQHKCFDRIRSFQEQGTNLLLVSHDRKAVLSLCRRAILLEKGTVMKDGPAEEVMDFYNASLAAGELNQIQQSERAGSGKLQTVSGTGEATVSDVRLFNSQGLEVESLDVGERARLLIAVDVRQDLQQLVFGFAIRDEFGLTVFGTNTWNTDQVIDSPRNGDRYQFCLDMGVNFGPGSYSLQTALVDGSTHLGANYEWRDLALVFSVVNRDKPKFMGSCWNQPEITIEKA